MTTVDEEINRCEAGRQEGAPPPVIILRTQVKVAKQNGGLWAGYDQDQEHQEKEAKHVVHLIRPDGTQNEEKLYKDAAKG